MAERGRFELPVTFATAVFKTAAINHSATSPLAILPRTRNEARRETVSTLDRRVLSNRRFRENPTVAVGASRFPVPIYEYHCPACKSTYELRQGFDAETTHTCEECGKGTAKRVLHAPPVVFKGSGWYVTDSRNKSSAITDSETPAPETSTTDSSEAAPSAPAATTSTDSTSEPAAAG